MKNNTAKIVKCIFMAPVVLVLLAFIFCEVNKAYWDYRVDEMCAKDGGITIYEKVVISKSDYPNMKFISTGIPVLPFEERVNQDDPFFYRFSSNRIYKFINLHVNRYEHLTMRNSDKKILAKGITYGRWGGDFPLGFESSRHHCNGQDERMRISESIITVKGE